MFFTDQIGTHLGPRAGPNVVVERKILLLAGSQIVNTGLFISPSGTSELDCATTKKDRAERIISVGRESLNFFLY